MIVDRHGAEWLHMYSLAEQTRRASSIEQELFDDGRPSELRIEKHASGED
jgi:hypothetical protein